MLIYYGSQLLSLLQLNTEKDLLFKEPKNADKRKCLIRFMGLPQVLELDYVRPFHIRVWENF